MPSGKTTQTATTTAPADFPVEGRPDSNLVRELRWYLEEFLGYPFPPETDHAERVLDALHKWGRQAFDALFDNRQGADFLRDAQEGGRYDRLTLQIASDDPRILAWPWEALEDRQSGLLAHACQIERRVDQVANPPPLDERLPRDQVNILLVTARPYAGDVRLRSISRPLVELVHKRNLPASVTVLRPPTFDQLRRHLHDHPHTYHVLHFDGHGGYGDDHSDDTHHAGSHCYQGRGVLVFEKPDGSPDEIAAEQLTNLLREFAVPAVVLNACQSAMIDETAADPFASVAAALLKSGTRSVVAMAYSLYVSGARQFVPAFYERLFESGDSAQGARAGRQQMFQHKGRICARGEFPLEDWLVPVVYQQDPMDFSFVAEAGRARPKQRATPDESKLPPEARDTGNPYGFIGRDGPLLKLERAMLRPPAGILIQGLGGVGKTTLARGFVEWLDVTGGLGAGCLWLDFRDIRSAEFVINRVGEAVLGGQFPAGQLDEKLARLSAALRENRVVIVWDNFEVACGIEGTSVSANLNSDDREVLNRFLKGLRGGHSKVLITSRSREDWLGHEHCYSLSIGGLDREESWEYCEAILRDLAITPKRDDPKMIELMNALGGHPLAMRVILPQLKEHSPGSLAKALRTNADALDLPESDVSKKLGATLRFVQDSLPAEQRPLLAPLSLHENFVDLDYLEQMTKQVDGNWSRDLIDRFAQALGAAGLLRNRGQAIHELHPALTGYLRATVGQRTPLEVRDAWARAFVDVMGSLGDALAPRALHEQRFGFHIHGANFHHALTEAERLRMSTDQRALLQSLAAHAQNTRDFAGAERLFTRLVEVERVAGDLEGEAGAYHQLGTIAQEQRDFTTAEQWYRSSLAIKEKQGDEHGAAMTYHQLGTIAQEQRDFTTAEQWYRSSLAITEKQGDEYAVAMTCGQLANLALEQRDFAAAEQWYRKAVKIFEKLGVEQHAAGTYHQLGMTAQEQRDFTTAEQWYRKAVKIFEKLRIEQHAAMTYHQLGMIAENQRDFAAAEQWYRRSLAINEKLGNEHGAASTYAQLGIVAGLQDRFEESAQWLIKSIVTFTRCNDPHYAQGNASNFAVFRARAPADVQAKLATMWRDAGLGDLPPTPNGKRP